MKIITKNLEIMESLLKVSEVELSHKTKVKASEREKITSSGNVYEILKPFYKDIMDYREFAFVVYLNRANKVIGVLKISEGGCAGTVVDPKLVFQGALLCNAQAIVLSHNHPSGNLKPSENDISLTKKCVELGKMLELNVLDHIILTSEGFYSFADEGRI